MLQQFGQLQPLTVHTGQGQHRRCVGLDGLSRDKIWMGGRDLGGEHVSFALSRVSIPSGCRRGEVKHCVVQLVGLPTSGHAVMFSSCAQWFFKSLVVCSGN